MSCLTGSHRWQGRTALANASSDTGAVCHWALPMYSLIAQVAISHRHGLRIWTVALGEKIPHTFKEATTLHIWVNPEQSGRRSFCPLPFPYKPAQAQRKSNCIYPGPWTKPNHVPPENIPSSQPKTVAYIVSLPPYTLKYHFRCINRNA